MFVKSFVLVLIMYGQGSDSLSLDVGKTKSIPSSYSLQISRKADAISKRIQHNTLLTVKKMITCQQHMRDRLARSDKDAANRIFQGSIDSLRVIKAKLAGKLPVGKMPASISSLDSLANTFAFLKDNKQLLRSSALSRAAIDKASASIKTLEDNFGSAEAVRKTLQSQKDKLGGQLVAFGDVGNEFQHINKEAYYYAQQLEEYKAMLHDKKKAARKAQQVLEQLPAYKNFMVQHSALASLLNLKSSSPGGQSLDGLQTRTVVEQVIQQRLGGVSPAGVSDQIDAARQQMDAMKNKYAGLNNAGKMPDFKPKELKTKTLRQRLEFGANTQFEKSTKFFPTTMDLAGQIGYKFSKCGIIGLGASYKLGMGTYNHMHFTSQGVGLRSFFEYRIKQTLYASGGFEQNYNTPFASLDNLYIRSKWTCSALLGVSKKMQLNPKLKGNIMLLYDFLWSAHVPTTQPLILRMGYNFLKLSNRLSLYTRI